MKQPRRPNLGKAIKAVMRDAAGRLPELSHVQASRILVVAGEARRASRATVRPLAFADSRERISADGRRAKPVVRIGGRRMLYVVSFRPMFFLRSTPEKRVETILHELFHMSTRFDGTLHRGRRHARLGDGFQRKLLPMVRRYLAECPADLLAPFAHDGEVIMRHWLERPAPFVHLRRGARGRRMTFTEDQLFYGPVKMVTRVRRPRRKARAARPG